RWTADRSRASAVTADSRPDGRRRRRPAGALAPVARRVGEAGQRQRAEVGELTAAVLHELADGATDGGRQPEAHARHRRDDDVIGPGEALDDGQTVGRVLDEPAP